MSYCCEGSSQQAAVWAEVTLDGRINQDAYTALYERRLLPHLKYANLKGQKHDRNVLITCPGLGCGQFAGPFHGQLGACLEKALYSILEKHGKDLPYVRVVYFDPYRECGNADYQLGNLRFMVRPLTQGNEALPQLCHPADYIDLGEAPMLFSFVAWDHVSWPGNDFYAGTRATDDGVKAAATDVMFHITGIEGRYNPAVNCYEPQAGCRTWEQVVKKAGLKLELQGLRIN